MYEYKAKVLSVYDGDTIRVEISLGFGVLLRNQRVRLAEIDTPEVRGETREEGLRVRDVVRARILRRTVMIRTMKDKSGKYGRWIAFVHYARAGEKVGETTDGLVCLNEELVREGMAVSAFK